MTGLLENPYAAVVSHREGIPLVDRSAQAPLHVRLSACDPDFADQDIFDDLSLFSRLNGQLIGAAGLVGIEVYGPPTLLNGGFSILSIEPGFDLGTFFPLSPNAYRFVPLQNHAVGEYLGQGEIGLEGSRKEQRDKPNNPNPNHRQYPQRVSSTRV